MRIADLLAARHARPAPALRGAVEGVVADHVVGWAQDPTRPLRRLAVLAWDGTGRSSRIVADRYRADLQQVGLGDGHCGFALPLRIFPGADRLTFAMAMSGRPLAGSPLALGSAPEAERGESGSILFGLDSLHLSGRRWSGWAIDRDAPDRPLRLVLRAGGVEIAQARATLYRPERARRGEDAHCGFVLDWAGGVDRRLTLSDAASGAELARLR